MWASQGQSNYLSWRFYNPENPMNINSSHRAAFISIFKDAVRAVNGARCAAHYLRNHAITGDVCLVAIGKAACSMASGARVVLGEKIRHGLVVTKYGGRQPELPGLDVMETGHPLPDKQSLEAGRRLLNLLRDVPLTTTLLFLISGGASALVDVLPGSSTLAELEELNAWLLQSGLPIAQINAIRKLVSCIKGGRLAQQLGGRKTIALLLSDVQGDDPAVIGSGLLFPRDAASDSIQEEALPGFVKRMLLRAPPMPGRDDPCFHNIKWKIIANLRQAVRAADRSAARHGYESVVHEEYLRGDAVACGEGIARIMRSQPGKLHIWGGETTVTLPENPGKGGRCQSLALSAALALQNETNWCLLAAGTDGNDGVMDAAGVCIDSDLFRQERKHLAAESVPEDYLRRADAGSFFEAIGGLLYTGPTGTNVADLVLGFTY
jgi:hydroxypyruvate reductase